MLLTDELTKHNLDILSVQLPCYINWWHIHSCLWHLGSTAYIIPTHIIFSWTGYDFHKGTCVVDTLIILKLGILTWLVAVGMHTLDISLKHSWLVIDVFMIYNHIFQPHSWVCHRHNYMYWTSHVHIWYS